MAAVCVFCASSSNLDRRWLELAAQLGKALGPRGHTLVSGGGRVGMMGAVADAARAVGAHTLGVIPQYLVDLEVADTAADELIVTTDMGERKNIMIDRSDAFITLPGGLGTLDELFEVWTTATLDLHHKPIILVNTAGFYDGMLSWLDRLADTEFVRRPALDRLVVVDSVEAALDAIPAGT
ncbi:TIGR00730 family Rossman fold protein [Actinoplanes sp. NPDC049668]|uniref:LOG family protein n=1 Tax=unclassified Actinoplanes TaxID=2626549 RepID=UPI00339F4CAC